MPKGRSKVSKAMGGESQDEELQEDAQDEQDKKEEAPSSKKGFDFNKYKVSLSTEVRTLTLDGTEFDVTVKPLSWSKKNQYLSKCLRWDSDGNTVFDGDAYVRLALQEMVVTAPWGKTSELFLISIDERLGNVLEQLVPQAFGADLGGEVDNLKDGS